MSDESNTSPEINQSISNVSSYIIRQNWWHINVLLLSGRDKQTVSFMTKDGLAYRIRQVQDLYIELEKDNTTSAVICMEIPKSFTRLNAYARNLDNNEIIYEFHHSDEKNTILLYINKFQELPLIPYEGNIYRYLRLEISYNIVIQETYMIRRNERNCSFILPKPLVMSEFKITIPKYWKYTLPPMLLIQSNDGTKNLIPIGSIENYYDMDDSEDYTSQKSTFAFDIDEIQRCLKSGNEIISLVFQIKAANTLKFLQFVPWLSLLSSLLLLGIGIYYTFIKTKGLLTVLTGIDSLNLTAGTYISPAVFDYFEAFGFDFVGLLAIFIAHMTLFTWIWHIFGQKRTDGVIFKNYHIMGRLFIISYIVDIVGIAILTYQLTLRILFG